MSECIPKWMRYKIEITKPILYLDMDGVLVDFEAWYLPELEKGRNKFEVHKDPHFVIDLKPLPGAIEAYHKLSEKYEVYILSTALWSNPTTWSDKRLWVEKYLGKSVKKKLILSHNKGLLRGDYLVDDRLANGVGDFEGEHIHFGSEDFPGWDETLKYLL